MFGEECRILIKRLRVGKRGLWFSAPPVVSENRGEPVRAVAMYVARSCATKVYK
jgi:hypothetical protein